MLEKAIVALQLLGHLAESNIPFQFKGGTSLLLRLSSIHRLSIDIDIVAQISKTDLEPVLGAIGNMPPFIESQHDARRDAALPPKSHYKFFYNSVIEPKRDQILLDVLFTQQPESRIEAVPIRTSFIDVVREANVWIPTVEALLGDKLTAFAPASIGVPYTDRAGEPRQTDVIKQLFDCAVLFDHAQDIAVIVDVYAAIHARQCQYRGKGFSTAETLDDSIGACVQLSAHDLKGFTNTKESQFFQDGIGSLQNHLVNHSFRRDEARIAAGKVACLAALIKRPSAKFEINSLRFDPNRTSELRDKSITGPWLHLNSLKRINIEAFHYWLQASHLNQ
jgi:hypothetical protein